MLECRLTEFEQLPHPVTHVIVEAPVTHRGDPKPLHFQENRERFERWQGRILYVVADSLPGGPQTGPWQRERAQREYCRRGLYGASANDIVLHGDLDEIPRMDKLREAIELVSETGNVCSLMMKQYLYAVDWYHPNLEQALTTVMRFRDLICSFTQLRAMMGSFFPVPNAGWHLSWIGGPEVNLAKLGVHCHTEMTAEEQYWPESGRAYREGRTHGGVWQVPVDDLSDYPVYIRERRCPDTWFRPR